MNPIWILMMSIGIVGANSLVLGPIATDVATSFSGSSGADVLTASAGYGLSTAVSALLLAPRVDMLGLRRSLIWAFAALSAMLILSAGATSVWFLTTAQLGAGFAAGVALPAIYGLTAQIAPKGRESETLGKVLTGWTLSLVAGVSISAVLSDVIGWRSVYVLLGAGAAVLAVVLSRLVASKPERRTATFTSPLTALRLPGLLPILMSVVAYMSAFYGLYAYLGTHLITQLGLSTSVAGMAALCYGVGFGAVAPLDRFIDRVGARRAAPLVFGTLALTYLCIASASFQVVPLLIVCGLWGAANHLALNILVGQLTAIDPMSRAAIMGLYSAVTYVAMFVGTTAFRPVFERYGFAAAACLSALCILPALINAWRVGRKEIPAQ